jgi:hypothetical protein
MECDSSDGDGFEAGAVACVLEFAFGGLALLLVGRYAFHEVAKVGELEICPRHNIPYGRRSADGRPACLPCQTQASARWRRRHPDYRRPALTEEQRLRRNERALRRYHEKRRARQVA